MAFELNYQRRIGKTALWANLFLVIIGLLLNFGRSAIETGWYPNSTYLQAQFVLLLVTYFAILCYDSKPNLVLLLYTVVCTLAVYWMTMHYIATEALALPRIVYTFHLGVLILGLAIGPQVSLVYAFAATALLALPVAWGVEADTVALAIMLLFVFHAPSWCFKELRDMERFVQFIQELRHEL